MVRKLIRMSCPRCFALCCQEWCAGCCRRWCPACCPGCGGECWQGRCRVLSRVQAGAVASLGKVLCRAAIPLRSAQTDLQSTIPHHQQRREKVTWNILEPSVTLRAQIEPDSAAKRRRPHPSRTRATMTFLDESLLPFRFQIGDLYWTSLVQIIQQEVPTFSAPKKSKVSWMFGPCSC